MIWLAWRQFRFPAAVVVAAAVALALVLLAVGAPAAGDQALEVFENQLMKVRVFTFATIAMVVLPAIIGMFWGAPLVARELEAGTHRLIWNQSVTRTRWLVTKLLLIGVAVAAVTGALGLLLSWWADALTAAQLAGDRRARASSAQRACTR